MDWLWHNFGLVSPRAPIDFIDSTTRLNHTKEQPSLPARYFDCNLEKLAKGQLLADPNTFDMETIRKVVLNPVKNMIREDAVIGESGIIRLDLDKLNSINQWEDLQRSFPNWIKWKNLTDRFNLFDLVYKLFDQERPPRPIGGPQNPSPEEVFSRTRVLENTLKGVPPTLLGSGWISERSEPGWHPLGAEQVASAVFVYNLYPLGLLLCGILTPENGKYLSRQILLKFAKGWGIDLSRSLILSGSNERILNEIIIQQNDLLIELLLYGMSSRKVSTVKLQVLREWIRSNRPSDDQNKRLTETGNQNGGSTEPDNQTQLSSDLV